jgi:hypothetical protein
VLWVERSAEPVTGPPMSHLRFDVLAEQSTHDRSRRVTVLISARFPLTRTEEDPFA